MALAAGLRQVLALVIRPDEMQILIELPSVPRVVREPRHQDLIRLGLKVLEAERAPVPGPERLERGHILRARQEDPSLATRPPVDQAACVRGDQGVPVDIRHHLARDVLDRPPGVILHVAGRPGEQHLDVLDEAPPLRLLPSLSLGQLLVQELVTPSAQFCLALAFLDGFTQVFGLELEHFALPLVQVTLLSELLPLRLQLLTLKVKQLCLLLGEFLPVLDLLLDRGDLPVLLRERTHGVPRGDGGSGGQQPRWDIAPDGLPVPQLLIEHHPDQDADQRGDADQAPGAPVLAQRLRLPTFPVHGRKTTGAWRANGIIWPD